MPGRTCLIRLLPALALALTPACRTPSTAAPSAPAPGPAAAAPAKPIHLTVVGTNDLHGWVNPRQVKLKDGATAEVGGVALLAGYLANLRAQNPGGVVLVDAGDLFQGTLAANLTEGTVVIDAYNKLGYQAAALGNHEFDYGPVGPISVAREGDDPFGAIKARIAQARFPLLAVNVYEAKTGKRPDWLGNDGTTLLELKGVKVGIFGLVTPQTPQTTNPVNVASLRFGSLLPEALAAAKRLREKGAEVVIGVAHAGGKCGSWKDPNDLSTCDTSVGEVFEMLKDLPPHAIDAVVAGHTHAVMGHFVEGVPVIETWGLGRAFGMIDLYLDPSTHQVLPAQTKISPAVPLCAAVEEKSGSCDEKELQAPEARVVPATFAGQKVVPDAALTALIAPALERVAQEQRRPVGVKIKERLTRDYEAESPLGSFLADSLRELERADVALLNSGGLRADLGGGELTYGQVYEVLPFDNTIATVTVTGDELRRLLQAAYGGRKGVFQISGLKVTLSRCPGQGRLRAFTQPDGRAISPERKYRVVMPDFLARGGDGLGPVLASLAPGKIDLGAERELNFRDALLGYWQKKKGELGAPKPGRLSFLDDAASCPEGRAEAQK